MLDATSNLTNLELQLVEPQQDGTIFKAIVDLNPQLRELLIFEN